MPSLSPRTLEKLTAVRTLIKRLPPAEQVTWNAELERAIPARYLVSGAPSGSASAESQEWDLAIANWLDRVYQAVSERVSQLGESAGHLAEEVKQKVGGFGLVVVLSAVAGGFAFWKLTQGLRSSR